MTRLPSSTVTEAADLLARGYRPTEPLGRVSPPLGAQPTAAEYVSDWCWMAMCMRQLQDEGKVR